MTLDRERILELIDRESKRLDDPRSVALGNEPVALGGDGSGPVVGRVTSGGFGYTVGASIAYAYVPAAYADPGTVVTIDVFGTWVQGEIRAEPLYDAASDRVKGVQTGAATTPTMT